MRVLIAGATGVLGRPLVPILTSVGHEVLAMGRPSSRTAALEQAGVVVAAADPLDRQQVSRVMREFEPAAVVNLLTAIPAAINPRQMPRDFALTNRLRTEGNRNLLDAAAAVGVRRIINQGFIACYAPGHGLADEQAPFWSPPPRQFASSLTALKELESRTEDAGGLVLRFGHLYGPGSAFASDGAFITQVRGQKLPVVGEGRSTFSFVHAEDAASAIVAALDMAVTGALNVVDDDPADALDWIPEVARLVGAPPPRHVPEALARLAVGAWGVAFMTRLRGADNGRAKRELAWRPRYGSWRAGLGSELAPT